MKKNLRNIFARQNYRQQVKKAGYDDMVGNCK